ncbi:MAG: Mth938-like domain-containing protein [candidate division Zixibacteria bacterium]|nr:Mth938-like domain-containing protein [candidate division Zixibacteria bacterium]
MIEHYEFGKMIINGQTYSKDLILYPDRIDSEWWRKAGHQLSLPDVKDLVKEKPDTIIVGTGFSSAMKVLPEAEDFILSKGIRFFVEDTQKAVKTYNELSPKEKVIGLFHLTC